jgi:DNA-binding transcriptional ArsR family regulator
MTRKLYSPSAGKWVEVESVETPSATTKQAKTTGPRFTMFPKVWRQQMRQVKAGGTTYEVAMVILDKARFTKGWLTLPNAGLAQSGIDRRAKKNALKELEDAGLIIVERRGRHSPRVKALYTGQPSVT